MGKRIFGIYNDFCHFICRTAYLESYTVDMPLNQSLQHMSGVEKVIWQNSGKLNEPANITVTLKDIANLQKTYEEINQKIKTIVGKKPYKLEIQSHSSPELESFYYDINFYLQEALANGNFPLLAEKTQEKAQALGVNARVYVDDQFVYVQFAQKDYALYAVVPRHSISVGGNT